MTSETSIRVLHLNQKERAVLAAVLEDALGALRQEVYKTENFDLRQELKRRETLFSSLLVRLPE